MKIKAKGIPVPSLDNRPVLMRHLEQVMPIFDELSHDRRYTQGHPLRLTTVDIKTYWEVFVGVEFEHFYLTMRTIDREWHAAFTAKHMPVTTPKKT